MFLRLSAFLFCFAMLQSACAEDGGCKELCGMDAWSPWSSCSKTCGEGTRMRTRDVCCLKNDTFAPCTKKCGLQEDTYQSEKCSFVCPAGTCSFTNISDTGLEATDFALVYDADHKVVNAPLFIESSRSFCERTCLNANDRDGYYCWAYTYSDKHNCTLNFFNRPVTLVNENLKGQSPGESVYIRQCTEAQCKATAADIVFVVDSSGSIGAVNFGKVKMFLRGMLNKLDIDPDLTRVGLLTFNDKVTWQFKLGDLDEKSDVFKAIQRMQYVVGGTTTAEALETVRNEGFTSNRTGVPKIAVVITDGLSRYPSLTRVRASILRQMGIQVYAIGVGSNTNKQEIFDMASTPEEKYIYEFPGFDDLDADKVTFDVNYVPCKEKVSVAVSGTVEPTTKNTCLDTIDNCDGYGRDICTDYAPWAHSHCSLYCGFCTGPVTEGACVDVLPNCESYGSYICQDKSYVGWVNKNCRRHCGVCQSSETTVTTSTVIPTTTVWICQDTIDNCDSYLPSCDNPKFRGFLEARCSATCGFCKSFESIIGYNVNGIKCEDWSIPTECSMVTIDPGCCPLPACPDGYIFTAEKPII